ncbi:MAG TPA: DUF3108 domain-containing protein [Rhizomicrobium sp.]|nr:DUF3108 domain-containing protein [Rhizomicrobium sp.]
MRPVQTAPFIRAACVVLLLGVPTLAQAAGGAGEDDDDAGPASRLALAMNLYAGGLGLGKVDLDATIRGSKYHAVSNLETSGIVNTFWQARIQATSTGEIAGKRLEPTLYDSYTTKKDSKQQVSLTYEPAGTIRVFAVPAYSLAKHPISPEQQKDTYDPVSAILFVASGLGADAKNPCGVSAPVFDGRRRYNIDLKKIKDTTVSMDNGLYKGPAVQCEARYNQIAGFSQKVLDSNASFPTINAWVATFAGVNGRTYVVPLRVWANTPYGVIAAVTSSLKIDGVDRKVGG